MLIIAFLLTSLIRANSQATIQSPTSSSLYHVPFDIHDEIRPNTIYQRFPQQKLLLRPQILSYRLLSLPSDVRNVLKYFTVTVFNKSVASKCHTNHCPWNNRFPSLIQRYARQSLIQSTYIMFNLGDQCHIKLVRQLMENQGVREPKFSRKLLHLGHIISTTPTWMMSIDLKNPMQKQRIVVPDAWMLFMNFQSQKQKAQQGSRNYPWNSKSNKIFWRGVDSGVTYEYVDVWSDIASYFPRLQLLRYSRDYPDIVDAKFSEVRHGDDFKLRLKEMGLNLMSGQVSVQNHMKHKYLISIDGWTAAWFRPQWIMSSNSLFVRQQGYKVQWFYHKLIPKKHYYPVAQDLSDLLEVYKYMESHQEEMQNITKQANQFARQNFGRDSVEAAFFEVLQQYSDHQNFNSVLQPLMRPGRNFEDIIEQFNDGDREKIFPPIGSIHLCKKQTEHVQVQIPPQTCKSNLPLISPYISLAIIGLSLFYFFTRLRIMCLVKGITDIQKNRTDRTINSISYQ